ncbi:phage integrase SAM-like domain-containing protein [Limnohabitans sp.]|uniref:phage integrase SAM-like domain-containing protein n=1 Tax=Limnohabitans sp. TaxID=1907725 RepID=UPI00286F65C7|nr:phage integrase SAM-like domain-containing protein [Limnohabitans sp.]
MLTQISNYAVDAANEQLHKRERTVPIPNTITAVAGYPNKLVVFKIAASKFWQVRCFVAGRTHRRTTKTTSLKHAQRFARWFYENLLVQQHIRVEHTSTGGADTKHLVQAPALFKFGAVAAQVYANEQARVERGELGVGSLRMFRNRLDAHVLPRFAQLTAADVDYKCLLSFSQYLSKNMSTSSVSNYLLTVRKVLQQAVRIGLLDSLPEFPKVKIKIASRGAFTVTEYWEIRRAARRLQGTSHPSSLQILREQYSLRHAHNIMPADLDWLICFMVNSFTRPGDIKKLQHKHVELIRGDNTYLRLTLPETKLHNAPVVTLRPAVQIYNEICKHYAPLDMCGADDYLFLPAIKDRTYAMLIVSVMFNWVLEHTGHKLNPNGKPRSLYSLRHSAITFRLLYGQGIDLITLARNARTSVEVINNHYASTVTGEQNIAMLQSRRPRAK